VSATARLPGFCENQCRYNHRILLKGVDELVQVISIYLNRYGKIWYRLSYNAIELVQVSRNRFREPMFYLKVYFVDVLSHLDKIRIRGSPWHAAGQL
jgi:hypothetical protein